MCGSLVLETPMSPMSWSRPSRARGPAEEPTWASLRRRGPMNRRLPSPRPASPTTVASSATAASITRRCYLPSSTSAWSATSSVTGPPGGDQRHRRLYLYHLPSWNLGTRSSSRQRNSEAACTHLARSTRSTRSAHASSVVVVERASEEYLAAVADMRAEAAFEEAVFDRLRPTKQKRFASKELDRLQRLCGSAGAGAGTTTTTLVAFDGGDGGGRVVGCVDVTLASEATVRAAGLAHDQKTWYYVDNVVVKDGYRGRGIGTMLMEAVEVEVGGGVLFVRVELNNTEAVRLYTKLGYENACEDVDACEGVTVGVVEVLCKILES